MKYRQALLTDNFALTGELAAFQNVRGIFPQHSIHRLYFVDVDNDPMYQTHLCSISEVFGIIRVSESSDQTIWNYFNPSTHCSNVV